MIEKYQHLIGVKFHIRTHNCFTLARRFYKDVYDIPIRDYAYPPTWWASEPQLDLMMRHVGDDGFTLIDVPQRELCPGDAFLMAIGANVACHVGIYVGGNKFLHHPFREDSRVDLYAGYWKDRTLAVVRHPSVPPPEEEAVDFLDLLPPHKKARYIEALQAAGTLTTSFDAGGLPGRNTGAGGADTEVRHYPGAEEHQPGPR